MKQLLIIILSFIYSVSFGQVSVEQPLHWWVSKMSFENLLELSVGSKILFQQNCNPKAPTDVPNGVIFFENVVDGKSRLSMSIEFKDTVVVAVTYYLKAKQAGLLKQMGYPEIQAHGSAIKGQWTYTLTEEKRRTTIVGDKKRIVVVQTP